MATFQAMNEGNLARAASYWVPIPGRAEGLAQNPPPGDEFQNLQCRPGQRYNGQIGDTATDAGVYCEFDIREMWGGFEAGHWWWNVYLRREGSGPWLIYEWGQG